MLILLSLTIASLVVARPSSYAEWAADSAIARGQGNGLDSSGNPIVSYEHGELQWGLRKLFERTGNATYFDYIQRGVDNIVFPNGTVHGQYKYVGRSGFTWFGAYSNLALLILFWTPCGNVIKRC
jgi:unsaturated rhamnogalacturonyl hydrolase